VREDGSEELVALADAAGSGALDDLAPSAWAEAQRAKASCS
jgi:hypothetical protein